MGANNGLKNDTHQVSPNFELKKRFQWSARLTGGERTTIRSGRTPHLVTIPDAGNGHGSSVRYANWVPGQVTQLRAGEWAVEPQPTEKEAKIP